MAERSCVEFKVRTHIRAVVYKQFDLFLGFPWSVDLSGITEVIKGELSSCDFLMKSPVSLFDMVRTTILEKSK